MTICLWYKFSSLAGSSQTLFEMSNGYNTEHVYIRRLESTLDLVFGVQHPSSANVEHRTYNGSGIARGGMNHWQHLCWTMQHVVSSSTQSNASTNASQLPSSSSPYILLPEALFVWESLPRSFESSSQLVGVQYMSMGYRARWNIYINGGNGDAFWAYENLDGIMPVEGAYSVSYLGYGTFYPGSFFSGSMLDARIYERALDLPSVRAIFSGDACCSAFTAGSYIDSSKQCTNRSTFNSEFCRSCKSDCGPLNFIENEDNACTGMVTRDNTLCQRCAPCAQGQFINATCSGTSFKDEGTCIPCR